MEKRLVNQKMKVNVNEEKIKEILERGVVNVIPSRKGLEKLLKSGKKLNVYLGIDPTFNKIHLGHSIPLRKLNQLAQLGHNVTFLIGDFTALIGDTSDKESERPILTKEEIRKNFKTYKKQAERILDFSKVKIKKNSEWLKKLNFEDIIKLTRNFTVGEFVNREFIKKRLSQGKRVRLDETLYPVMQGYDSFFLDTDIQIGAADQTFNMQAGRTLIKNLKNKESYILVMDYLPGIDGRKMSKSWGNAIWINDKPSEMFAKIMSIRDEDIFKYFELCTNISPEKIKREKRLIKSGKNPIETKKFLAFEIVKEIYGENQAIKAKSEFEKTFQEKKPDYKKRVPKGKTLLDTIGKITKSRSEAKRLIKNGAVDVNEKTIFDPDFKLKKNDKIKIGKKIFITVV